MKEYEKILGEMQRYLSLLRQHNPNYDIVGNEVQSGIQVGIRSNRKTSGREHIFQIDQDYGVKWITKGTPSRLRALIHNSLLHFVVYDR